MKPYQAVLLIWILAAFVGYGFGAAQTSKWLDILAALILALAGDQVDRDFAEKKCCGRYLKFTGVLSVRNFTAATACIAGFTAAEIVLATVQSSSVSEQD